MKLETVNASRGFTLCTLGPSPVDTSVVFQFHVALNLSAFQTDCGEALPLHKLNL